MTDKPMKNVIADKYIELLNEGTYRKVTVSLLTKECDISRQTFYYHFDDLNDVLDFALKNRVDELHKRCLAEATPKGSIRVTVSAIAESTPLITVLMDSPEGNKYKTQGRNAIKDLMEEYLLKRATRVTSYSPEELQILLSIYSWGLVGITLDSIREFKSLDVDMVTEQLYRVFSGDSPLI